MGRTCQGKDKKSLDDEEKCCRFKQMMAMRKAKQKKKNSCKKSKGLPCAGTKYEEGDAKSKKPCIGSRKRKITKRRNDCNLNEDLLKCLIKPSIFERSKYTSDKHLYCVLNDTEVMTLVRLQEIREKKKGIDVCERPCNVEKEKNPPPPPKKICRGHDMTDIRGRRIILEDGRDCDSICSFDSIINLQGLELTKEELEKIRRDSKYKRCMEPLLPPPPCKKKSRDTIKTKSGPSCLDSLYSGTAGPLDEPLNDCFDEELLGEECLEDIERDED